MLLLRKIVVYWHCVKYET